MKLLDITSKLKKSESQKAALDEKLKATRLEIISKRELIQKALMAGDDIEPLLRVVAKLQEDESLLLDALQAVRDAKLNLTDEAGAEQREKAAQELKRLKADMSDASKKALGKLVELSDELHKLEDAQSRLSRAKGAYVSSPLPFDLFRAVYGAVNYLRMSMPELIGLPPKPTKEELRRKERAIKEKRKQEQVAHLKEKLQEPDFRSEAKKQLERLGEMV